MVIYDGDLGRASFRPTEDKAPLVVDPDRVEPRKIPLEGFEPVPGRHGKVGEHTCPVHLE